MNHYLEFIRKADNQRMYYASVSPLSSLGATGQRMTSDISGAKVFLSFESAENFRMHMYMGKFFVPVPESALVTVNSEEPIS